MPVGITVEVVIPSYRPGEEFASLLALLLDQTRPPDYLTIINTHEPYWDPSLQERFPQIRVTHIRREEFDHGGTRHHAMVASKADVVVYMTQDALPRNRKLLERLLKALNQDPLVGCAYARQLPKKDCLSPEKETRSYNYPSVSRVKSQADVKEMGIKAYFCSNVCAAYRRDIYLQVGGFPQKTIFNEDMIFTCRLLRAGYKVAYAADAQVYHSHNYTLAQQFHRNFDLGVSQAQFPDVFSDISSEGEGVRYVRKMAQGFLEQRAYGSLTRLFTTSAAKYVGYFMGKHYDRLPRNVVLWCTSNRSFWG